MEVPIEGGSPAKQELVILKKSDQNTLQVTTTMAETFHQFPNLPKELRLKIWEQVMIEARPSRRIIIDEGRVIPLKQLISPLLLVNYESRTCAKAFYNVKLDIYAVPPVTQDEVKHLDKQKNWDRIEGSERAVDGKIHGYNDEWVRHEFEKRRDDVRFSDDPNLDQEDRLNEIEEIDREEEKYTVDLEGHWYNFIRDELRFLGASSIRKAETSGPTTGAFYISPEHDVFITDHDCTMHFSIKSASRILGESFPSIRITPCHHISEKLATAICQRVSTLVVVRFDNHWHSVCDDREKHCVFADYKSIIFGGEKNGFYREFTAEWCRGHSDVWCWRYRRTWKKNIFPSVRAHFVLRRPECEENSDFLTRITEMNNFGLSKGLELWEKDEFNGDGKVRRGFKNKKDRFSTEKADWVRDLMAHWDTSN